jgi:hypothetical protein
MTAPLFPFAGLLIAHDASAPDASRLAELARTLTDAGASPVVVAVAPDVEAPPDTRVVRTRARGAAIAAVRLGMAQLTNTVARAALLVPFRTERVSLVTLLALLDAGKRTEGAIVGLEGTVLDRSPLLVPRDAWLELVTLGDGGLEAVIRQRTFVSVDIATS